MELLNSLAQNGLLSLLLAISYAAIWFLFQRYASEIKKNDELQEKRINDHKQLSETTLTAINRFQSTADAVIKIATERGQGDK